MKIMGHNTPGIYCEFLLTKDFEIIKKLNQELVEFKSKMKFSNHMLFIIQKMS